jgi:predicted enzyme related to lactoylglutathione lyase
MQMTSYPEGMPSWPDCASTDPEAAAEFYGRLFGWEIVDMGEESGHYRMCRVRGQEVAAIYALSEEQRAGGVPPNWTTYISTDDVDGIAKRIDQAGGALLMPPMDVMTAGRVAIARDPGGAVFGLWQPRDHIGAGLLREPGAMTWNEVAVTDRDAGEAFYREVFEYGVDRMDMGMPYTVFKVGEQQVAGLRLVQEGEPPHWDVVFAVESADATSALASELRGEVLVPPTDIPTVGRFAALRDPQGAAFQILQAAAA